MISRAQGRYIRLTPRKFRQVIPLVKGMKAEDAISILMGVKKKASTYAIELLKSAIANAKRVQGVDAANLYISRMVANGGPQLKRFRAASMGRAAMVRKRTSHIIVELDNMPLKSDERRKSEAAPAEAKKAPPAKERSGSRPVKKKG